MIVWSGVFVVEWAWIWDFLSRTYNDLVNEDYVSSIAWKAVISDLYYKNLEIARTNEISSIKNTITNTLDFVRNSSEWTCNINEADIVNILYYSNDTFKRSFKQNILNFDPNAKAKYPNTSEYLQSCNIFMWCVYGQFENDTRGLELSKTCSQKLNEIYISLYSSDSDISTFDQINYWDDLFWNGKLDDADYDLLYDISIVWKILFEWFKSSPQVLYYQFPDVNYWSDNNTPEILDDGTVDWYSPYDPSDFLTGSNSGQNNSWNNWDNSSNTSKTSDPNSTSLKGILDDEVLQFIDDNTSPSYAQNQYSEDNIINWNICISWSILSWTNETYYNTWEIISWYLNVLINQIDENKTQWNSSITNWGSFVNWEEVVLTWDEVYNQIEEQVDMLSNINDPDSQSAILSCIDKCDWMPVDDKLVCIVKCTCTEFSSPAFNDNFKILDEWAFKIKFCMIPVQNRAFSQNWKVVFSIEEIYEELYAILASLRDGWELLVHKKTKEFLESSVTKNKFGKIFSFNVWSAFKNLFSETSDTIEKRNEELFERNVAKSILSYGEELNTAEEKNKYSLLWDPDKIISQIQISNNVSSFQNKWMNAIWDPSKSIQADRLLKMNQLIVTYLDTNLTFWEDVLKMMEDINSIAEFMSKK